MKNTNNLGMPIQCIETGKVFVEVYGKERALDSTQRYRDALYQAYALIEGKNKEELEVKSKIGTQAQFWREVTDSIGTSSDTVSIVASEKDQIKVLLSHLKEARERLAKHISDPLTEQLDEKSNDYDFIKLLDTLITNP